MLDSSKNNQNLGQQVHRYLTEKGVETPMNLSVYDTPKSEQIEKIAKHFTAIMEVLGLNLEDDSLQDTPMRVGKMFINEIFWGLDYRNFPKCTAVENKMSYDEMVVVRDVKIMSSCEHHFLPIHGTAHIAYIPKKKVLGLSKINRIAEFFAARPQIQERLAEQVFHALKFILETEDVAIIIEGEHFCVKMRGVSDVDSDTVTSKLGGAFHQPAVRAELLSLIQMKGR